MICIIIRVLWHAKIRSKVQFVSQEEFDAQFVPNVLESMVGLGGITSCFLVRACEIAFLLVYLCFAELWCMPA